MVRPYFENDYKIGVKSMDFESGTKTNAPPLMSHVHKGLINLL